MGALRFIVPVVLGFTFPAWFVSGWLGEAEASLRATEPGASNVAVASLSLIHI